MSFMSRVSLVVSNFDIEVKRFFHSMIKVDTVAALGSTYADAAPLTSNKVVVTASNNSLGVKLPAAEPDAAVTVVNSVSGYSLLVYPNTGDQINALTVTTQAFTQAAGSTATYLCDAAGHWYVSANSLTGTATTASSTELNQLTGSSASNNTTGKVAILGTSGAISFNGAMTAPSLVVGSTAISEAEIGALDGVTLGTSLPSKALTTDAAESLVWATTDATASETVTLSIQDTRTGAGATGWAHKDELVSNVALGSYANAAYGLVTFGSSGRVTGLAAGVCGEVELSAGTTQGTYASLECELTANAAVSTGTDTGFIYANIAGSNGTGKTTVNTSAHLMVLGTGVVDTTDGLFDVLGAPAPVTASARLRIKIGATAYYLPVCAAAALSA